MGKSFNIQFANLYTKIFVISKLYFILVMTFTSIFEKLNKNKLHPLDINSNIS